MKSKAEACTAWSRTSRTLRRLAIAAAAFTLSSCVASPSRHGLAARGAPHSPDGSLSIVVVTIDGVRFREVFEGVDVGLARAQGLPPEELQSAEQLMPHLHALIATRGAAIGAPGHGEPISASGPNFVSLPGYAEIFSGRRVTRCRNNQCTNSGASTLIDELGSRSDDPGRELAVITSWPDIERVASRETDAALSTGRHGGRTRNLLMRDPASRALLERGENVGPYPGHGDFRPDYYTGELALYRLIHEHPRFLFVGLGEPDEYGHHDNYRGYLAALRLADQVIGRLDAELTRQSLARGARTALFVTTDHGRSNGFVGHGDAFPESARVWLVAAGSACTARGLVDARAPHRLADLAPTVRELAGLPPDSSLLAGAPLRELFAGP